MIFMCRRARIMRRVSVRAGMVISARLVRQQERACFSVKFKKHIPLIVPIWLIPAGCGGVALYRSFSWPVLVLIVAFAVNSYVILPLVAKRHSCGDCPQRKIVPGWPRRCAG